MSNSMLDDDYVAKLREDTHQARVRHNDDPAEKATEERRQAYRKNLSAQEAQAAGPSPNTNSLGQAKKVDSQDAISDAERNTPKTPGQSSSDSKQKSKRSGFLGKLLAGSKGSPLATGGVIGLLIGGVFGSGLMLSGPLSLLVNLSTIGTNHANLSQHIYTKMGNSYFGSFLAGKNRDCARSKIKCHFTRITEKKAQNLRERGFTVRTEPSHIPGLLKLQGIDYKQGDKTISINSRNQWNNLKYTDFSAYAQTKRWPLLVQFLHPGATMNHALKKFGINIGNKLRSSKNPDKNERAQENKRNMNAHIDAKDDPKEDAAHKRKKIEDAAKEQAQHAKNRLGSFKNAIKLSAGFAGWGAFAGCVSYDLIRAVKASVSLAWHAELIKFASPFFQAGSMAKDGEIDWETAEMYADALMKPVTQEDIDADPSNDPKTDLYTQDMLGKTAMDSKGVAAALNGDALSLDDYASKYTAWAPVGAVIGAGLLDQVRNLIPGGHKSIKLACQGVAMGMIMAMRGCIKGKWTAIVCGLIAVLEFGLMNLFGDDILKMAADYLAGPAMEAVANAGLNADLHGPALGEAIIAGRGVLGSYMDRAGGLPVASTGDAVKTAYTQMYTDKDYIDGEIAYKKYEASQNQFDLSNQYSFGSQFISRIASIPIDGTLFSVFANLPKIVSPNTFFEGTARAMREGIYQPIEIFQTKEKIEGAMQNCTDPALSPDIGIDIPGMGESCQTVPVIPKVINDCLDQERVDENKVCILDAIDYLSTHRYTDSDDDFKQKPYIDGDTGKPTGFSEYGGDKEEKTYANPLLMYMQYCGRDRKYAPGHTDKPVGTLALDNLDILEEGGGGLMGSMGSVGDEAAKILYQQFVNIADDWYDFTNCADGKWASSLEGDETTFAWMSYYVTMCMAIHASEENVNYCWDDAPAPQAPTQSTPPASTGTIALDPGHNAVDITDTEPVTGAILSDYPNHPELEDAWDIASRIKTRLEQEGYTVKMLRSSVNESVNYIERAERAKGSAMVISIHTTPAGGSTVSPQFVGGYRSANGKTLAFKNEEVASKSQECATAMAAGRNEHETNPVSVKNLSFDGRGGNIASGNLPWVQLLSQDTPWIYNEMQPFDGGGGANGMSEEAKIQYVEGTVAGIKKCNLPKGSSSNGPSGSSNSNTSGNTTVSRSSTNNTIAPPHENRSIFDKLFGGIFNFNRALGLPGFGVATPYARNDSNILGGVLAL